MHKHTHTHAHTNTLLDGAQLHYAQWRLAAGRWHWVTLTTVHTHVALTLHDTEVETSSARTHTDKINEWCLLHVQPCVRIQTHTHTHTHTYFKHKYADTCKHTYTLLHSNGKIDVFERQILPTSILWTWGDNNINVYSRKMCECDS